MSNAVSGVLNDVAHIFANPINAVTTGNWGPTPGQPSPPQGGATLGTPPSVTSPPPASTPPGGPAASSGAAGTPGALSPGMKEAIASAVTGQLPGLVAADTATGNTGLTPGFLSSQAGEASGFTNQQSLISQAVQNWLQQNPGALQG